jgi:anti-sigma factor RsiW
MSEIDDVRWSAFRYVAGELSATEAAEFEARLEHDLTACLALAETVAVWGAVRAAVFEQHPVILLRPKAVPRGARWAGLAAAASLVAVLLTANFSTRPHDLTSVAIAWSNLQVAAAGDPRSDAVVLLDDGNEVANVFWASNGDEESGTKPPDWMVEVLALESGRGVPNKGKG